MLVINDNQLTNLHLSNNSKLTEVYCYNNQLTNINVSNCKELTTLYCNNNKLSSIDVTNNTKLENFKYDKGVDIIGYTK